MGKNEWVKTTGIHFLAEQDGPIERKLKQQVADLFFGDVEVESAYLVRAQLSAGSRKEGSVVLAYRPVICKLFHDRIEIANEDKVVAVHAGASTKATK